MSVFGVSGLWAWMLDGKCTITRPGTTTALRYGTKGVGVAIDDSGDVNEDPNVPCHFQTAQGTEAETWQREHDTTLYTMYLPSSYTVPTESKITYQGTVYEVIGPGVEQGIGSGIQTVNIKVKAR